MAPTSPSSGSKKGGGLDPFRRVLAGHTDWVTGCSLSADGSRAITCSDDETSIVWDLTDGGKQPLKLDGHTEAVTGCSLSADGSRAITCSDDKTSIVWDLSDGGKQLLKLDEHTAQVTGCSMSADGSRAITCSAASTLHSPV
eukprot:COSAG06_NODE_7780_length_2378_cov_4.945590_1_plen_141_part_10